MKSIVVMLLVAFALSATLPAASESSHRYRPRSAWSGPKPQLPPVLKWVEPPVLRDGKYTVWGASYSLRHRALRHAVNDQRIQIQGVIGKTNLADAPKCAVHRPGVADPDFCHAPLPTFWVCDKANDKPEDCIRVMGWASNFAQIYGALTERQKAPDAEYLDAFWGTPHPNPIPAAGARVTITGNYGQAFTRATLGAVRDQVMGLMTYEKLEYHSLPPERVKIPFGKSR